MRTAIKKRCCECGKRKILRLFHRCKTGTYGAQGKCKRCHKKGAQEWRTSHPEYSGQRAASGYWHSYRWERIKQRYGLERHEYESLLKKQGGLCAICGGENNGKHLVVDHDHKTGKVRGLLCGGCNHALGFIEKRGWKEAATEYLVDGGSLPKLEVA
jgi:hypothetical protein